jgi:hypothetical protein
VQSELLELAEEVAPASLGVGAPLEDDDDHAVSGRPENQVER